MFSNPKNKEMIWELLKEQSKFPLTRQWRSFFELTFENVEKRQRTYPNLVAMNKHLISICMEEMTKFIINELEKITTQFQSTSKEAQKWLNREENVTVKKLRIDKETNKKIETIPISQKKVSFNLNPYSLKIHYTENGVSKDMYCRLGSDFKLFTSQQVKPDNQNIILENIELYTK